MGLPVSGDSKSVWSGTKPYTSGQLRTPLRGVRSCPPKQLKCLCSKSKFGVRRHEIRRTDSGHDRRPCHRNSLRRAPKALQRALRLGMVLTMPSTTTERPKQQTMPTANVGRDDICDAPRGRSRTERVTFRRLQIMREGRENTASYGPIPLEKGRSHSHGTPAGSWPASPALPIGRPPPQRCGWRR